jgi:hypothetical protein
VRRRHTRTRSHPGPGVSYCSRNNQRSQLATIHSIITARPFCVIPTIHLISIMYRGPEQEQKNIAHDAWIEGFANLEDVSTHQKLDGNRKKL